MKSFNGVGGDFDDIEFCDTSLIDPNSASGKRNYQWWAAFSEGKRFTVPNVAAIQGTEFHFNVEELVKTGTKLISEFKTHYPNSGNFGRKSFDKIVKGHPMSFPKAVMAIRTVNAVLAHHGVVDSDGKILEIGRHEILMAGYRVEGLSVALGEYMETTRGQTDSEDCYQFLFRESQVSESIIKDLSSDDGKFVSFPTAHAIATALLRNREKFRILGPANERTLLRLGPPPGTSFSRLDLKNSVPEYEDPLFLSRASLCPHPDNPYKWAA